MKTDNYIWQCDHFNYVKKALKSTPDMVDLFKSGEEEFLFKNFASGGAAGLYFPQAAILLSIGLLDKRESVFHYHYSCYIFAREYSMEEPNWIPFDYVPLGEVDPQNFNNEEELKNDMLNQLVVFCSKEGLSLTEPNKPICELIDGQIVENYDRYFYEDYFDFVEKTRPEVKIRPSVIKKIRQNSR